LEGGEKERGSFRDVPGLPLLSKGLSDNLKALPEGVKLIVPRVWSPKKGTTSTSRKVTSLANGQGEWEVRENLRGQVNEKRFGWYWTGELGEVLGDRGG